MHKITLACSLGMVLIAAPALIAQQQPVASATAAAPKGAHPKSAAESKALQALNQLAKDPATTPAQMDAAITGFVTQFPTSDYIASVNTFGLQYYQTPPHESYSKSLLYGEQAIKADPTSVYALTTIGDIIPNHVTDTDLDRDQRLKEATDDDNAVLKLVATAGATIHGQPFPQGAKNEANAIAYSSLARIANLNKDYAGTVSWYAKAIPLDPPQQQAVDYFYTARAQISMKAYTQALASLDAAQKAAPDNPQVQAAVASNKKFIQDQLAAKH
ncbi:MAG TPA: hypothetical protein VMV31_12225 [Terriglobales bacterium]|nr:hypothetical protein [Terriglobales bacterium]